MKPTDYDELQRLGNIAAHEASEIVEVFNITDSPVDPFRIASEETPLLTLIGGDFGRRFDGQLEYHAKHGRFLLFYNTELDPTGQHPRIRFSVAHELGHFYLTQHRSYLLKNGKAHASRSEFTSQIAMERQADIFSAHLLMPPKLLKRANRDPLTIPRLKAIATRFQTSLVSTAIRTVQTSDFPCALIGYRDGRVAWRFASDALRSGGCYPGDKGTVGSDTAQMSWIDFERGTLRERTSDAPAGRWFRLYGNAEKRAPYVTEHYLPVSSMGTMLVLLTIDEGDLFDGVEQD